MITHARLPGRSERRAPSAPYQPCAPTTTTFTHPLKTSSYILFSWHGARTTSAHFCYGFSMDPTVSLTVAQKTLKKLENTVLNTLIFPSIAWQGHLYASPLGEGIRRLCKYPLTLRRGSGCHIDVQLQSVYPIRIFSIHDDFGKFLVANTTTSHRQRCPSGATRVAPATDPIAALGFFLSLRGFPSAGLPRRRQLECQYRRGGSLRKFWPGTAFVRSSVYNSGSRDSGGNTILWGIAISA